MSMEELVQVREHHAWCPPSVPPIPIGTISPVPNKPKTPGTNFRIPSDIKTAAQERAAAEGKTLSEVVVKYLERYGKKR